MQHTGNERLVRHPFFGSTGLDIHQIGRGQSHIDSPVFDERRPGRFFKALEFGF